MSPGTILLIIGGALLLALIFIYNSLVRAKIRVNEAWSDITVQMKRRLDLIPNLISTVKGYAKHERELFEKVTRARTEIMNAKDVKDTAKAENAFQSALKSIFAVAENYPDLKANQNFLQLQDELVDTEDKIQAARRFYNGAVRDLNTKIEVFPTRLFAAMLGFKQREFFETEGGERETAKTPPKAEF